MQINIEVSQNQNADLRISYPCKSVKSVPSVFLFYLPSNVPNVEECDATDDEQGFTVGNKNIS